MNIIKRFLESDFSFISILVIAFGFTVTLFLLPACDSDPTITDPHNPNQTVTINFSSHRGGVKIFVNGSSIGNAPQQMVFVCGDTLYIEAR